MYVLGGAAVVILIALLVVWMINHPTAAPTPDLVSNVIPDPGV